MRKIKNLLVIAGLVVPIAFGMVSCGNTNETENVDEAAIIDETPAEIESASGKVIHMNNQMFKDKVADYVASPKTWIYKGDKPCIIDFYATWCGPCKRVAPIFDELAKEYDGKLTIYKVDTDKEQELAAVFGIQSIPSILFVPMEGQPQMYQGAFPKEQYEKLINEALKITK